MTLPAKLGFGAVALGSVGGLGYVGTKYFSNDESNKVVTQPKTIKELIDEKYTHILLSAEAGDNPHWNTNWAKYKTDNQEKPAGQDTFQLPNWTSPIGDETNLITALKEKCSSLKTSTNDSSYEDVIKYCARDVSIADQAKKLNLRIMDTQKTPNEDDTIWGKRIQNKDSLRLHFDNLGITFESAEKEGIKSKCNENTSKTKKEDKYEAIFVAYKAVCTKQQGEE